MTKICTWKGCSVYPSTLVYNVQKCNFVYRRSRWKYSHSKLLCCFWCGLPLRQLHGGETAHSNNGVMKKTKWHTNIYYEHINIHIYKCLDFTSCCARTQFCHVLCGAWCCPEQCFVQKRLSYSRETYYRGKTWCNVGGWGAQPAPPVHSSDHGWHPIPWLRGHEYLPRVGCPHLLISALACGTRVRPSPWNSAKRESSLETQCLQRLRSRLLCILPPTRRRRLWDTRREVWNDS